MTDKLPMLDPVLHQPARTQIVAFLSARGEASFTDLKRALGATDGNLGAHLGRLVEAGYAESRDAPTQGRGQTVFRLTAAGRGALEQYVQRLSALMAFGAVTCGGVAPALSVLTSAFGPTLFVFSLLQAIVAISNPAMKSVMSTLFMVLAPVSN